MHTVLLLVKCNSQWMVSFNTMTLYIFFLLHMTICNSGPKDAIGRGKALHCYKTNTQKGFKLS